MLIMRFKTASRRDNCALGRMYMPTRNHRYFCLRCTLRSFFSSNAQQVPNGTRIVQQRGTRGHHCCILCRNQRFQLLKLACLSSQFCGYSNTRKKNRPGSCLFLLYQIHTTVSRPCNSSARTFWLKHCRDDGSLSPPQLENPFSGQSTWK